MRTAEETLAKLRAGARPRGSRRRARARRRRRGADRVARKRTDRRHADVAGRRPRHREARRSRRDDRARALRPWSSSISITPGRTCSCPSPRCRRSGSASRRRCSPMPAAPALAGTITYISPKAEFTPRNVQTAEERSKLVYRVRITVDNKDGVLKQGMPVEAEIALAGGRHFSAAEVHGRDRIPERRQAIRQGRGAARRVVQRRAAARCSG